MPQGKIKFVNLERKFGFITPDDGSDDVKFFADNLRGGTESEINVGAQVYYELRRKARRPTTFFFEIITTGQKAQPAKTHAQTKPTTTKPTTTYRFLNPYNFVRFLEPVESKKQQGQPDTTMASAFKAVGEIFQQTGEQKPDDSDVSGHDLTLLGKCPPPPHDRYVGLSGTVTCRLETATPLFISDAEGIDKELLENGDEHKTYRFFQHEAAEHRYLLPASSLRGMIRNVFESVTNSCMAIFDDKKRLQFRAEPKFANSIKKYAGVVRQLASPATENQDEVTGIIELCATAEVPAYYTDKPNVLQKKPDGSEWLSGDRVVARIAYRGRRRIVRELGEIDGKLADKLTDDTVDNEPEYVAGWLKITGLGEGTEKKNELFIFDSRYNSQRQEFHFDYAAQEEYNEVVVKQLELEGLLEKPLPSTLGEGDLVYAYVEQKSKSAGSLHRVQIPKMPFRHRIGELWHGEHTTCDHIQYLCPACRTFGWVHQLEEKADKSKEIAYTGRVRFSHGTLQHKAKILKQEITLAILSSPKPTTTSFYLLDRNGKPDFRVTYNDDTARLRGRKFYRHHGNKLDAQEYTRSKDENGLPTRDGQNRTVKEVLDHSNRFIFTVDFTNLAPVELGALLWALEMRYQDANGQEKQLFHRLGFARPLGFGSVKIDVEALELLVPAERYTSLEKTGRQTIERKKWQEKCVALFQSAMKQRFGKAFQELENIQDLIALLTESKHCGHIHYPRPPFDEAPNGDKTKPKPEGKQFEWFVGNKSRNSKKFKFTPLALPLATEDFEGFPLVKKDGRFL